VRPRREKEGDMTKKNAKRGSTMIALLVVVAALAGGPAAGVASAAGMMHSDASWAEGA
jgi:hypothetical protein